MHANDFAEYIYRVIKLFSNGKSANNKVYRYGRVRRLMVMTPNTLPDGRPGQCQHHSLWSITLNGDIDLHWQPQLEAIHRPYRSSSPQNMSRTKWEFSVLYHLTQRANYRTSAAGSNLICSTAHFSKKQHFDLFYTRKSHTKISADRVLTSSPANTNLMLSPGHWTTPTLFRDVLTTITIPISKSVHPNLNNNYTHLQISSPI